MINENNDRPILTIAIPTYNRINFLMRAVESVLKQKTNQVELLISDNASTDETPNFMEKICNSFSGVRYIRNKENIGSDNNFLQCYREAKGRFVLLIGDDDLIVENALGDILPFLRNEGAECKLVFLNHVIFQGAYSDLSHCEKPYLTNIKSFTTTDKRKFMALTTHRMTYIGALVLQKESFLSVDDPEKYNTTSFIHTCIAFQATREPEAILGIIGVPCVAQDATFGNATFDTNLYLTFKVFGAGMEYVYCELAPQCGYDKQQMESIYEEWISRGWPGTIFRLKWGKDMQWKQAFRDYAYPVLMKHKRVKRKIMPYVKCPDFIARIIYSIYQKIRKVR